MPFSPYDAPYDQLMAAAEHAADTRPEVDREIAREVFAEAATLLHNGLVLDALDEHDTSAVIAALAEDLVATDPGDAIRSRAQVMLESTDLHDPGAASDSLLVTAALFGL